MIYYNFSNETNEYLSNGVAKLDPIDKLAMIPANATTIKPPSVGVNEIAVFENNSWVIKKDYRGSKGFLSDTREDLEIKNIGDLPFNFVDALEPLPKTQEQINSELKLVGVLFEGVMCSATSADMWGLNAINDFIAAGNSTNFHFDNGNKLVLTPQNYQAFSAVWIPFRQSFFAVV